MDSDNLDEGFESSANFITKYTHVFLKDLGVPDSWIHFVNLLLVLAIAVAIVYLLQKIVNVFLTYAFKKIEKMAKLTVFKYLLKNKMPHYLALIVPYTFIVNAIPVILVDYKSFIKPCLKLTDIYLVFMIIWMIMSIIRSFTDNLQSKEAFRSRPMKSYLQVIQIILYIFGAVAVFSILTGKSATAFFAAMGAASAVLMLMFKDTIMGFVGSIQISSNKMVMLGDWITMSKYGADGVVEEISLTSVKVRNFDKTITTIPTYNLISDSFQNWRGMQESGGRRLKRALIIKQSDIRFLTDEELDSFEKMPPFINYLKDKRTEYDALNKKLGFQKSGLLQGYKLTNCDLFVRYCTWYLDNNPNIRNDMALMVRQLSPTTEGLPIELYTFVDTTESSRFENVAGEIMNHLQITLKVFGLTIFEGSASSDSLAVYLHNQTDSKE